MCKNPVNKKAVRLIVSGHVQGVGFRYSTVQAAASLHLTGFVRNLHDGSVEIVAEGEELDIEDLIKWATKGPVGARVSSVEKRYKIYSGFYSRFSVQ